MKITPKLNIDADIENLPSGELAHASNIVVNNTNDAILTENGIKEYYSLDAGEKIVGYIACSDGFVVFTSNSRIIRVNEKDDTKTVIQTNWKWQGGEVISCYTYNANQELIVAISERIDYNVEPVPIKIINLDKPNYIIDGNDNKYTLSPEIPKYNLAGYSFETGNYIDKGVYNFFIRFKIGNDYTAWFYLGYPINVFNTDNTEIIEKVYTPYITTGRGGGEVYNKENFEYSVRCDDEAENVAKNINLTLDITLRETKYESYQIGYIVTTIKNETKTYTTPIYDITNKVVIIDGSNYEDTDIDELTRDSFNIFNAKTLCNYNNRIYLANYNEENLNTKLKDVDLSGVVVKAKSYQGESIQTTSLKSTKSTVSINNVVAKATSVPTARAAQCAITNYNPTEFRTDRGYIVDMYMAHKTMTDSGATVKTRCNFKLFINRFCTVNNKTRLLIKVADIIAAAGASDNDMMDSSNFIFDVSYNPNLYDECRFLSVEYSNSIYCIRFISDDSNIIKYPTDTNSVNISRIITTGSGYNANQFNYGFKNSESTTANNPHANIPYNSIDSTDVNSSDIFITSVTEVELTSDALQALEPCWFYRGKLKLNDDTFNTYEPYMNDYSRSNPYYTTFPSIENNKVSKYKYLGAFSYSTLLDENYVYNKIKEAFPDCNYKFYRYCIDSDNDAYLLESEYRLEEEINPDDTAWKSFVTIGYFKYKSNIYSRYNLIKICYNAYDIDHYLILSNKFMVVNADGTETEHDISEIFTNVEFEYERINDTVQDFVDYWNEGGDQGYVTTYQWREDKQPGDNDFNTSEFYNVDFGKVQAVNFDNISGESIFPDTESTRIRLYGLNPMAVGFRNIGDEDPDTHVIQVDKDFCIVIPLTEFVNNLDNSSLIDVTPSETSMIRLLDYQSVELDRNYFNKYYVLFRLQDTFEFEGGTKIVGHLCTLYNDTPIDSAVPVFKEIIDSTYSCHELSYPGFFPIDRTTPFLRQPLFFIREQTTGELSPLSSGLTQSEYLKVALNHAVYNFFLHFVDKNGNFTAGLKIPNNMNYEYNLPVIESIGGQTANAFSYKCDENTTVGEVKNATQQWINQHEGLVIYDSTFCVSKFFDNNDNLRICNLFPIYNNNNIALYVNSAGDKFFRGTDDNHKDITTINELVPIKFEFENIPILDDFVGYFVSYETPEHILLGEGPVIAYNNDFNDIYNDSYDSARFYYPEFNILKKSAGGNIMYFRDNPRGGQAKTNTILLDYYEIQCDSLYVKQTYSNSRKVYAITNSTLLVPNDAGMSNGGREGCLKVDFNEKASLIAAKTNDNMVSLYHTFGILLKITDSIYTAKNKNLIPLGLIKYYDDTNYTNTYGKENYAYNYDYYNNYDINVIAFNKNGVVYDEVNFIPTHYDILDRLENNLLYPNMPNINSDEYTGNTPICRMIYNSYNEFDIKAIQIDNAPVEHYYTVYKDIDNAENEDNNDIFNINTIHIYPQYVNDLFKYASSYNNFTSKLIINYDEEVYTNFVDYYGKTIRRSKVMSDESIENRWRIFDADDYKIITENKGNIMNVVGVGVYLIAHCEHSLFVFNRDNQLKTEDKDVQMLIPDTFEIDYTEVFPTDKGYAGLQDFNQWCVSNYGYVFLDKDSKKVYQWDNDNLNELTVGMKNLFNRIDNCRFAVETNNDRLICIGQVLPPVEDGSNVDGHFAISYSFIAKSWVSTHTYWYEKLFNTKNKTYFILDNKIHTFDYDSYNNYSNVIDDSKNEFKSEIYDNVPNSFIDVVFNNNGVDKVLDYISYRINKATDDTYSGNKLLIYSNICYSNYCDISKSRKSIKDYKNPVFRFGIWVYNWFRNYVLKIGTTEPIIRGNGKFGLTLEDLGKQVNNNALIVGKYFVVRLIFADQQKRISVNDVQCY